MSALYGEHVTNTGSITSQNGSVALAAGSSVYLGEAGGNIFVGSAVAIPKARVISKPGVTNTGTITAPKATLVAGDMYGMAIAQSGSIVSGDITIAAGVGGSVDVSGRLDASNRAPGKTGGKIKVKGETIAVHDATLDASGAAGGGTVTLDGGHNTVSPTTVTSSGTIAARGEGSGAKGGTVKMLGDNVGLLGHAVVDVSGDAGGGTVLLGGDYQGKNPEVQNAARTYISLGAQIYADALTSGNGGRVIVWADDWTRFYGSISARGGEGSGSGGFVEVSGKLNLNFAGAVNLSAAKGDTGTLLLDPATLNINSGLLIVGQQDANLIAGNDILAGDIDLGANKVAEATLENLLLNANVVLEATGLITLEDLADNVLNMAQTAAGSFRMTSTTTGGIVFADSNDEIRTAGDCYHAPSPRQRRSESG